MNKTLKITLNILLLLLVAGFGYYMVRSLISEKSVRLFDVGIRKNTFVSPYKKVNSFNATSEIVCFYIHESMAYVALSDRVSLFDLSGKHQQTFAIEAGIRDIFVDNSAIYLLYPTRIVLYSLSGQEEGGWEACSDNSDYCALTVTAEYVFVTDAGNKNICQYDREGLLVRFINSPEGFIIPSYSFDIISIDDTVYCSNSGRYKIESYTLDGEFIASFGVPGTQAGAFAGCCNPVYLEKTTNGNILTSEKGTPRISCFGKDGTFRSILFDSNTMGGGTVAYEMHVSGEEIFIASKKTISVYIFDSALSEKACAGCEEVCPLH